MSVYVPLSFLNVTKVASFIILILMKKIFFELPMQVVMLSLKINYTRFPSLI